MCNLHLIAKPISGGIPGCADTVRAAPPGDDVYPPGPLSPGAAPLRDAQSPNPRRAFPKVRLVDLTPPSAAQVRGSTFERGAQVFHTEDRGVRRREARRATRRGPFSACHWSLGQAVQRLGWELGRHCSLVPLRTARSRQPIAGRRSLAASTSISSDRHRVASFAPNPARCQRSPSAESNPTRLQQSAVARNCRP